MERSGNQRHVPPQTTTIIKQFPPPPPSKESETSNHQRMPTVFDASTNRRLRGGQAGTPDSKCTPNKPCTGMDRERMKDMMADSFSRHETIAILPGFKEDGRHGRTCIKVNSNSANNQQMTSSGEKPPMGNPQWKAAQQQHHSSIQKPQNFQVAGQRGPNNINCKPNGLNENSTTAAINAGSPGQPWPYSQKSQQSIRETQAAYRRDLEKQIEEKRQCKDKNIRKSVSSSAAGGEQVNNNRPVNQSLSLEEFRNTGFLPSWFDPVKNNPLYNSNKVDQSNANGTSNDNQEATQEAYGTVPPSPVSAAPTNNVYLSSCAPRVYHAEQNFAPSHQGHATGYAYAPHMEQSPPCDYYVVPKEMIDQMNRNNGCFPMQMEPMMQMFPNQHHQTFYGPPADVQHDRGMSPSSGAIHIESTFQQMHNAQQQHPNMPPAQMVQYIRAPQQFQRQMVQPVSHPSISIFPYVQPGDHHQEIAGEIEDHQKVPFHPTSSHLQTAADQNESQGNLPSYEAQQFAINLRNLPPPPTPPCPQQEHVSNLGPGKFGNRNPCKMLENMAEPINNNNEHGLEQTDPVPTGHNDCPGAQDEDSDGAQGDDGAQSQESGREDDDETEAVRNEYKAELARQIEEKKRQQQELLMKEEEKNAKFERKIQEDQKRMTEEYEEEQRKQKLQHEELVKRQEAFLKERERYEKEAELERLKQQAASNRAQATTPRQAEQEVFSGSCTPRIKVSESTHEEMLAEAKRRAGLEGQVLCGSPRPRTVVICHSNSKASDTLRQDVRGNNGDNSRIDEAASGDAKVQSEGILFLSDLKKAIKAEDERMTRILSKKRPQIIASHYMS